MENLLEVLEKETFEYQLLMELSQKKTPIIIEGDLPQLAAITDEEQSVVSRISTLEKKREEVVSDIADVINKDVKILKIVDIIHALGKKPQEQQKLAKVHDELKTVVKQMVTLNEHNRSLIANSLEIVEFELNLVQAMTTAPQTADYNKGAYSTGNIMGGQRGVFDAKQ